MDESNHDHDFSAVLERNVGGVAGRDRITVFCQRCGWRFVYDGTIAPCSPPPPSALSANDIEELMEIVRKDSRKRRGGAEQE